MSDQSKRERFFDAQTLKAIGIALALSAVKFFFGINAWATVMTGLIAALLVVE